MHHQFLNGLVKEKRGGESDKSFNLLVKQRPPQKKEKKIEKDNGCFTYW